MSIVAQLNPFELFVDASGKPLDYGYIYIGEPNKDPRQYPVQGYFDAALQIPAPSPLRTTNGFVYRNGSPAFLYINGNYSIMVLDSTGRQVYFVADFLLSGNGGAASLSDLVNTADPKKGISIIPTASRLVPSIAILRTLPKSGYSVVAFVEGYYSPGDGGGGNYYIDAADTTSVDNGGTVIVAADGGRWKLITQTPLNVRQFGAKGDSATDDTSCIQAAINALPATGGLIFIPTGGFWRVDGVLSMGSAVTLMGSGPAATTFIKKTTSNCKFIDVTGESSRVTGIRFIALGETSEANTYAIESEVAAAFLKIDDCHFLNCASSILMRANSFRIGPNVDIRQLKIGSGVGVLVDQSGVQDGIGFIDDLLVINNDGQEGYAGILLTHAVGILISNTQVAQGGHSIVIAPTSGKTVTSIKMTHMHFDTSDDGALFISNSGGGSISRLTVADSWLSSAKAGAGVRIVSGSNVQGLTVSDCEFYDNATGIQVDDNCTVSNLEINNGVFAGNSSADISIGVNNSNFSLRGCRTGVLGGFGASPVGLFIGSGCSNYSVVACDLHSFSDGSAGAAGVLICDNKIANWGFASIPFDPPLIANNTGQNFTIGVPGAIFGDITAASITNSLAGLQMTSWVSSAGVVTVRLFNATGVAVDISACTLKVSLTRRN